MLRTLFALSLAVGLVGFSLPENAARAQTPKAHRAIDYAYVDLIFRKYDCVDCHSDAPDASAKLNLTTFSGLTHGSKYGKVMVAGDSAHSRLFELIPGKSGRQMPPEGARLTSEEVATIRSWVDQGARAGRYGKALSSYYAAKRTSHWRDALHTCKEIQSMHIDRVPTDEIAVKSRLPIFEANGDEQGWVHRREEAVRLQAPQRNAIEPDCLEGILDPDGKMNRRDIDLGFKAASLAVEDTQRQSGAILDSLAWAFYLKGDSRRRRPWRSRMRRSCVGTPGVQT